ncbi:MAG: site-specific DNA-methyltransferase [Elusimicrobiota bacterium]
MNNNSNITKYLNQIFLKDIIGVMKELPDKSVDMVYGDPDYNVGIKYGDTSYTKTFDEYMNWYIGLVRESLRVLKNTGNIFLINYPKQNAYLRVKYLDNTCYEVSDYVWVYNTNVGHSPNRFTTAHRSILHCRKTKDNNFYKENVAVPYQNPTDKRILGNMVNGSKGRMPYDWFYFNLVKNVSKEKTFHSCQIPQKLSEMLIKSCTMEGDIVLILFGGSGSEIEVCRTLKRKYISAEIDEKYHKMILDRLNKGKIEEKYKLKIRNYDTQNISTQLTLLEEHGIYLTKQKKARHSV